jgi:NAD(P)H-flavin reductase
LPGQYVLIAGRFWDDNHPFSIAKINDDGSIEISFKHFGDFTRHLSTHKAGDQMMIVGAYGEISKDLDKLEGPLVFLAGGIGITPFRAIIHTLLNQGDKRELYLYYGVRDPGLLAFHEEFIQLASIHPNFHYLPVLEKDPIPASATGFISMKIIQERTQNWQMATYFVCGPPIMMHILAAALKQSGIKPENIRNENFGY